MTGKTNTVVTGMKKAHHCCGSLNEIKNKVNGFLSFLFIHLTKAVVRNIWKTVLAVIFLSLFCAIGWTRINLEFNIKKLYAPQNSQALLDFKFISTNYDIEEKVLTSHVYITHQLKGTNILRKDTIRSLFDLHELILSAANQTNANCILNQFGECAKIGVLAYWNWNRELFEAQAVDETYLMAFRQENVHDCCALSGSFIRKDAVVSFSAEPHNYTEAQAFHMAWMFSHSERKFEKAFIKAVRDFSHPTLLFHPENDDARTKASEDALSDDLPLVGLACILLTLYCCSVFRWKYEHASLGIAAVIGVGLSIVAAFGLVMACGISYSLMVNAVVFIALGIGVDDAFIITKSAFVEIKKEVETPTPLVVLPRAMTKAGPSITLTSLTDFLCFIVAGFTMMEIPAIAAFGIYAATTVFSDFLVQITFFPAVIAWNLKKKQDHHQTTLCCSIQDRSAEPRSHQRKCHQPYNLQNISQSVRCPLSPKVILSPAGKSLVLFFTIILLIGGTYGILGLKVHFNEKWFVPDNHFLRDTWHVKREYFQQENYLPVSLYTKEVLGGYGKVEDQLQLLIGTTRALDYSVNSSLSANWFESFQEWEKRDHQVSTNSSSSKDLTFEENMKNFLKTSAGKNFNNRIAFKSNQTVITATEIPHLWDVENCDSLCMVERIEHQRTMFANIAPDLHPIIYSPPFPLLEGLAAIRHGSLKNLSITCATIFICCLVVLGSFNAAFLVLCMIVMIDICLLGSIWWIGETINPITAVTLIMSLGLTVDYCSHTAHSFLVAQGQSKNERAAKTLSCVGGPVFNAAFSSFVAIMPGAGATHYVFKAFFKIFLLILGLGVYFALVVFPVLLSIIGPSPYEMKIADTMRQTNEESDELKGMKIVRPLKKKMSGVAMDS